MPYAYQCCAFGVCENVYKISNQWNKGDNSSTDDLHKKDAGMFQVQGKTSCVWEGLEKSSDRSSKLQTLPSVTTPASWESIPLLESPRERKFLGHLF